MSRGAPSWPVRLGRRLWDVGATLLGRDTMVVTNAIAFNFLLCLFPLLLALTAAAQALPGRRASNAVLLVMHELIPFEREALAQSVHGLRRLAPGLTVFSLLVIVWGSSGIFMPVEMALARAWGSQPRTFVRSRLLAFAATLGGGLLAFLSVAVTVLARSYNDVWPRRRRVRRARERAAAHVRAVLPDLPADPDRRRSAAAWPCAARCGRARPGRSRSTCSSSTWPARTCASTTARSRSRSSLVLWALRVQPGARLRRAHGAGSESSGVSQSTS